MTTQTHPRPYYPHIDGLRAIAVLPVMLYHLGGLCPGGYAGVDVFFVISGYLITLGIIKDLKESAFRLSHFYFNRIRRIMPAYFVLIAVVLLTGCLLFSFQNLVLLGESALFSTAFASNVYFLVFTGAYFDEAAENNPLLNLWSLSVEEQFYLLIPITLLLTWKAGKRAIIWVLLVVFALSFYQANHLLGRGDNASAFYLLFPRAWELLAGALLALLPDSRSSITPRFGAPLGLALVLTPYVLYSNQTPFPGIAALPSVLGAALLIRNGSHGPTGRLLCSTPCVWAGKISYSLYLYHWPVFVFWNYCTFGCTTMLDKAGMFILACILAHLSWRWVETPIRSNKTWFTHRVAFSFAVFGGGFLMLFSGALCLTNGAEKLLHVRINAIQPSPYEKRDPAPEHWKIPPVPGSINIQRDWLIDQNRPGHLNVLGQTDHPIMALGAISARPHFLLFGDSHAMALTPGMHRIALRRQTAGIYLRSHITPLWNIGNGWNESIANDLLDWLSDCPDIKTVIIANRWLRRFNINYTTHGEKPYGPLVLWDGTRVYDASATAALIETGMQETCRRLHILGKEVVVLGPIPETEHHVPEYIRRSRLLGRDVSRYSSDTEKFRKLTENIFPVFRRLEQSGLARIVYLHEPLIHREECITQDRRGVFLYHDRDHLSPEGASFVLDPAEDSIFGDNHEQPVP